METQYELYHHGILGMKWGIRRFQPYPKGKKPAGAKEIGEAKIDKKVNDSKKPSYQEQFKLDYRRDNDVVFKKGDYLYRADANKAVDPNKKAIYASLKEKHLSYLNTALDQNGVAVDMTVNNGNDGKPYSLKLKLEEDLIMPSYKKAMDTFVDTIKDLPVGKGSVHDPEWGGSYNNDSDWLRSYEKIQGKGKHFIKKELRRRNVQSVDELKSNAYLDFVDDLFMDGDRRKLFFDGLEKQGYNAIVDENDYHANAKYNGAVLVFKKSAIKQVGSKPVQKSDENYIYENSYGGDNEEAIKNYPKEHKEWKDWMSDKPKKKR